MTAEDLGAPGSQTAEASNTVLVDNLPPTITIKNLAVDYKNNLASLAYSIPKVSSVEVSVFDKNDVLLSELVSGETQADGDHQVSYLISGEGERYFGITAQDRAKNTASAKTDLFSTSPDVFCLTNCQAVPATFTPNGQGHLDLTRISYQIAGGVPDYQVNLNVQNSTGGTVKTLVVNDPQGSGTYSFYWDGKNDAGQIVPDGYYDYVVAAADKLGNKIEGRGRLLLVATRPTVGLLGNVAVVSPGNSDANNKITLNYSVGYSTFYISGEALVKLEVINSTGEAVWTKIFNKTAGSYLYDYDGSTDSGPFLPAGSYYVRASAQDALGSTAVPQTIPLAIDYSVPTPSDFTIIPAYAKPGTNVNICLNFTEQLAAAPTVSLTLSNGVVQTLNAALTESGSYECGYAIGDDDPEGTVEVTVSARNLAMNQIVKTSSFVIDKTSPEVSGLSVSPNPAGTPEVSGQVSIKFIVSEPLQPAPNVYVTQNGAAPQLAVVSGQWQTAGGQCEAKYPAIPGYDGPTLIMIEATDLAGNQITQPANNLLTVDTIPPTFSNLDCEIASNPEYAKFASEGATVAVTFIASEPLKLNPDVRINGNPANYGSQLTAGGTIEYTYNYTVSSTDTNGTAEVSISGYDPAGNNGIKVTSSSAESFVIDLTNPTVAIADPASTTGWISNPPNFSTNANPDGSDRPRSTTFYYQLTEPSKVTVKVYKVPDGQTTYAKTDFNDGNLIKTLAGDLWQTAGSQTVAWDGTLANNQSLFDLNNDGFADPGKYAFIVEGRDRAGNLTLKKWGGTVWIQNNVLTLKNPDQFDFGGAGVAASAVNPNPHFISPNGTSTDPTQKRARFYFIIPLTLDPAVVQLPERIEAQTVAGAYTKKIGRYSVKVYSDSGLTNLVRTVTSEADAWSASLMYDEWDGKNDAGQFVADGTFWLAVDVKDYAGNPAQQNLLKQSVVVDNTAPVISDLSTGPYYFSPGSTPSTIETTALTYEVYDNYNSSEVTVAVYKGGTLVKTLVGGSWMNNGTYSPAWDGSGQIGFVGTANGGVLLDGIYTFVVSAIDQAGNLSQIATRDVYVDTQGPNPPDVSANLPVSPAWSTSNAINLTWPAPDDNGGSGTSYYQVSKDGGPWSTVGPALSWSATLEDSDNKIVDIRAVDNLGNIGNATRTTFRIDTVPPYFNLGPNISGTPQNSWTQSNKPAFTFSGADATSGWKETHGYIDGVDQGAMDSSTTSWQPTIPDGSHDLKLRVYDNAGLYTDSPTYAFLIDTTLPNAPSVSVSNSVAGTWTNQNKPIFTWSDPGDGNGSGVRYYKGYIDDVDQGTVSSGWQPTLSEVNHTVDIKAVDGVGLFSGNSNSLAFSIDLTPPSLSFGGQASDTWYSADNAITVSLLDNYSYRGFKWAWDSWPADDPNGCDAATSGTTTHGSQGPRTLYVRAWDWAGNETTASKTYYRDSVAPIGSISFALNYTTYTNSTSVSLSLSASDNFTGVPYMQISVDNGQTWTQYPYVTSKTIQLPPIDGLRTVQVKFVDGAGNISAPISTGIYLYMEGPLTISAGPANSSNDIWGDTQAEIDSSTFTLPYDMRISNNCVTGANLTSYFGILRKSDDAFAWSTIESVTTTQTVDLPAGTYYVWILWEAGSNSGNVYSYVTITGAPAGSVHASSVPSQSAKASALETPILIAPEKDKQNVSSIRPAFKWQHHKGTTTNYQIDMAKNDTFSIAHQTFTKSPNTGSPDSKDPTLYNFNYSINEFDPGLDKDTYYWKVTALATNEAATSEVWSFTIAPDLTLTDITNYPNPFNPNKEKTKLRYRLSTDASEVKIRIYDITGRFGQRA